MSQSIYDTSAGLLLVVVLVVVLVLSYVRLTAWLKAAKQAIINEVFMVVF